MGAAITILPAASRCHQHRCETCRPNIGWYCPHPNGAALSFSVDHPTVLAGCLRNATAVAKTAARLGSTIAVIPAGETWSTGELRPSLEDWVGSGAVVAALSGRRSPEARLAAAAFSHFREGLLQALRESVSGKELIERGFGLDLDLAAELSLPGQIFTIARDRSRLVPASASGPCNLSTTGSNRI